VRPQNTNVWDCIELKFKSSKSYGNAFRDVTLRGEFIGPRGEYINIPGFWDGDNIWKIRFAPTTEGCWTWKTMCSDIGDSGLHCQEGEIIASPWAATDISTNPNRHGFLKVHESGRYFTYADGTKFYWLGDTLWMMYTERCDEKTFLPAYIEDRKEKGFTLVQVCIGRPSLDEMKRSKGDETHFSPEDFMGEGGAPYIRSYDLINPEYFEYIDRKISMLLEAGFVPCIMGMWGQDLEYIGVDNAKEFWRYIIARYSAYNVLWSISGEYFFTPNEQWWREIGQDMHMFDPYRHPTTVHSTAPHSGSRHYQSEEWYDFNLVQVGHVALFKKLLETLPYDDYHAKPVKPSIMSESWYENHPSCIGEERRLTELEIRMATYIPLFQGCIGQSYGAHGIWSVYDGRGVWEDYFRPFHWQHDLKLPVSSQMKHLRTLMDKVRWWELEPRPDLVTGPLGIDVYCTCIFGCQYIVYAVGKKDTFMVFVPGGTGEEYKGQWFNPRTGEWSEAAGEFAPYGSWWRWTVTKPDDEDWVLVLKRTGWNSTLYE